MATPIEAKVDEIVSLTHMLDAGLSLLLDHARKDRIDVGSHRADGAADDSVLAVPYVATHRADGEVAL